MEINSNSSPAATGNSVQLSNQTVAPKVNLQQAESSVVSPTLITQQEIEKTLIGQMESVNAKMDQLGVGLAFSMDENTRYSVVKVIDRTTDEVIKQYPTEGALKIMHYIQNYLDTVQKMGLQTKEGLTGTLFNEII